MKIKELKIRNIRGIRDLVIPLNGKNITVWGPNGTGKSGVVDSVDFLLTGEITRLVGKGTKDLSLKRHGVHIDASIDESFVEATINLNDNGQDIILRRLMSDTGTLIVEGCEEAAISPILDLAKRGQHVLSRREILTFITAEPNTRATQIQNLLNIGEVEKTRKNLQSISNLFSKAVKSSRAVFDQAKSTVAASIKITDYDETSVLRFVNEQRKILSGNPFIQFRYIDLREEIERPGTINKDSTDLASLDKSINFLSQDFSQNSNFEDAVDSLFKSIKIFKEGDNDLRSLRYRKLYSYGISLIKEDDLANCPLCEDDWEQDKLLDILSKKEIKLKRLELSNTQLLESSKKVKELFDKLGSYITSLVKSMNAHEAFTNEVNILSAWIIRIQEFSDTLSNPIENIDKITRKENQLTNGLQPDNKTVFFNEFRSKLKKLFPKARPDQVAWETLIALEENLKSLEKSNTDFELAKQKEAKSNVLIAKWTSSRDSVLENLYSHIEDNFTSLYRDLHGDDESEFTAKLSPSKAALNFHVDFHGRGNHAPHALHSEGHQDSMGLCLFLALADYLAQGVIDIVLLDDVVMSVDAEHRRSLCGVLKKHFPQKQFIITTHDQTWANQLKTEGVTTSRNSLQFYNWSLEGGPQTNFQSSLWSDIDQKIEEDDIPGAAAKLRRGSEDFFESACDLLEAKVTYRQNRRWELGQFMPPAVSRLKEILEKAKQAARSWGDDEKVKEITDYITIINQVNLRTQSEQWGVNSAVHYNEWAKFAAKDFIPIKESFQDLFGVFKCSTCEGSLRIVKNGLTAQGLKCPCSKTMFNLAKK